MTIESYFLRNVRTLMAARSSVAGLVIGAALFGIMGWLAWC